MHMIKWNNSQTQCSLHHVQLDSESDMSVVDGVIAISGIEDKTCPSTCYCCPAKLLAI